MNRKAVIAMSGGVDSAVAALLMMERGYACTGLTMRLVPSHSGGMDDASAEVMDAGEICRLIGIKHHVVDFRQEFDEMVIDRFVRTYMEGRTPNPCISCNRYVKFAKLLMYADEQGADTVVTGHYVQIQRNEHDGMFSLKKALDASKDQSYVLYNLTQDQLSHICFPLGGYTKEQAREIARRYSLPVADKHDSQDICFVADGDYGSFVERHTGSMLPPGDFIDVKNNKVGRHKGLARYTIGQRKGLHLAMGQPVYVTRLDAANNTVTVGLQDALYHSALEADDINWVSGQPPESGTRVLAKTRYHSPEQPATMEITAPSRMRVVFDSPQRAMTPGQAVVLYFGDSVLGGGTIQQVFDGQ